MARGARLADALSRPVDAASLAAFRMLLGGVLLLAVVRSLEKDVVAQAFEAPTFFFPYYGIGPLPSPGRLAYGLYGLSAALAGCLMLGCYTRASAGALCLVFSYLHFVDVTNYLNHYYLVTLLTGLLAVVPIGDVACLTGQRRHPFVPQWVLLLFRFQLGVVYFFGGVAKLEHDWLFDAQPLATWLAASTELPILGDLFRTRWAPYLMSYLGAAFDLTIPFALSLRRVRPYAYVAVLTFHLLTARLFQIGIFPYLMMASSLLFFSPNWPRRLFRRTTPSRTAAVARIRPYQLCALALYAAVQLLVPLRHWLYPGNLLWHEQGYRFAWNVMLIEKTGSAEFTVVDKQTGARSVAFPRTVLTRAQTKIMATQPDLILAFAHELARRARLSGRDVAVYADVIVALNGRAPMRLVDPTVDLAKEREGFANKRWILPGP
jgi:vitamin K-dependent gamma-carboxylase